MEWFRLHSDGILEGSIRSQLTLEEGFVWVLLLAMANKSRQRGVINRGFNIGYPLDLLAARLAVPVELLQSTIDKCSKDIGENGKARIEIDEVGCIHVNNWEYYQTNHSKNDKEPQPDALYPGGKLPTRDIFKP